MNTLFQILGTTFLISLISLVGIATIYLNDKKMDKILLVLIALSAGSLMGGAFLHLIPESVANWGNSLDPYLFILLGFSTFFVLEQFIEWTHEHRNIHKKRSISILVLIADIVHNFIDGLIIAASFRSNIGVAKISSIAIALHEIPQEIGDYGVLLYGGFSRKRALLLNFGTALSVVLGGFIGYYLSTMLPSISKFLIPFAAGDFIYIAASDLIPEIKHGENVRLNIIQFIVFVLGVVLMYFLALF